MQCFFRLTDRQEAMAALPLTYAAPTAITTPDDVMAGDVQRISSRAAYGSRESSFR
jgi:hypothetical protein